MTTAACALLAVTALALRDPHRSGSWGRCPVLLLTGYPCPGCGGLRAVYDLAHGQVFAALGSNALVVLGTLAGAVLLGRWFWRRAGDAGAPLARIGPRAGWYLFAMVAVFGALRLVPGLTWLVP